MVVNGRSLTPTFTKRQGLIIPKNLKWPRVLIGIPVERTINQHAFHAFLRIAQRGHAFIKKPYTRTDIACNSFVEQLLESDFTHLLILGSDHIHPPDVVERLIKWVKEDGDRKVVAGLNFRRGAPFDPLAFVEHEGQYCPIAEWEQGLVKVDLLGTGTCLISREVFETIPKPWFYYDYSKVQEGKWISEDITFCNLCTQYGFDLWVDTTTVSPHLITTSIDENTFRQYMEENPLETVEV